MLDTNEQRYPKDLQLFVAGAWRSIEGRDTLAVENPATREVLAELPIATAQDIDDAIASSVRGFAEWSAKSAWERSEVLIRAANGISEHRDRLASILTLESGKTHVDSQSEIDRVLETVIYSAEEGKRAYGRVYPPRSEGVTQVTLKRPLGPVAAFVPWNFPLVLLMRKVAPALAAGCSVVAKPAEECPASCIEMIRILVDAGVTGDAINLLFGIPADISDRVIAAPEIRKISFTGSIAVGKMLAAKAGSHMKEATMELGGHAPVVVFDDVDVKQVVKMCAGFKYRNSGQVCIAPSRFYVQEGIFQEFLAEFRAVAEGLKVGPGIDPATQMGPLINQRRLSATEALVEDAVAKGAQVVTGGKRLGDQGYFFAPTILTNLAPEARILDEEPFCPIAPIMPFTSFEEVIDLANRGDVGLAAYAFTNNLGRSQRFVEEIEAGWVGVNDFTPVLADAPTSGHKDSGLGLEGGSEGLDAYLETKFVSQRVLRTAN